MKVTASNQIIEFQLPPNFPAGIYVLRAARSGQSKPYTAKLLVN